MSEGKTCSLRMSFTTCVGRGLRCNIPTSKISREAKHPNLHVLSYEGKRDDIGELSKESIASVRAEI